MFYWIECTIKHTKSYFISHFVWYIAHAILLKSHIQRDDNLCAFCWYSTRESKICWRLFSETYLILSVEDNLRWDKSIVIRGLVKLLLGTTFQSETVLFLEVVIIFQVLFIFLLIFIFKVIFCVFWKKAKFAGVYSLYCCQ